MCGLTGTAGLPVSEIRKAEATLDVQKLPLGIEHVQFFLTQKAQ